jgi:hypothetical protein
MTSRSTLVERQLTGPRTGLGTGLETELENVILRKPSRPYRQKIRTLSHITLDAANGAVLRDVNEFGIAMQTAAPLSPGQQVRLRFELASPRVRIETTGRVAWTDSWGQAGVQFLDLPERSERLLKEWIFIQILSAVYLFAPCESAAVEGNRAEGATELLFSASPRPAIQLEAQPVVVAQKPQARPRVRLLWCPVPISLSALTQLLDGLILLCAVLLFAVMALAITNILPTWPVAILLAIAVAAVFAVLYWFLFVFWFRKTPGEHLARLAYFESGNRSDEEEDVARFR